MKPGQWNMLSQYLSGMGAGLNPDPWVQNLNKITQQNIEARSQVGLIDLFKNMLSGKVPGAKANLSEKGMNLTLPSNVMGLGGGAGAGAEGHMGAVSDLGAGVSGVPTPTTISPNVTPGAQQGGGFLDKILNPSVSQSGSGTIPPSALAGLSAQDVSAALSGALNIEQLRQKQIMNTFAMGKVDPLESEFPIPHPEAGLITQRQWSSLPTEEREFSAYVHAAKELGAPKNELTREFFSTLEPTDREQFLRATMEDPALREAMLTEKKAGRTVIDIGGETLERERAKHQAKILSPDFFQKTAANLKKDGRAWRSTSEAERLSKSRDIPFDKARSAIQQAKVRESMDKQIRQVFGGLGEVTRKSDGWYLDGELIVRDPYVE